MKTSPKVLRGTDRRNVSMSLRFPVEEYLRIQKAARKMHLSVSDYVRLRLPEATVNYRLRSQAEA